MFFNLCSSAGVQGVFVRLFLAGGGPIGEDAVMLGSSAPTEDGGAPEGPDIAKVAVPTVPVPAARFLFRAPVGDAESCLTEASVAMGCVREGDIPDAASNSCLSTSLDIGDEVEMRCAVP
jgi:hypothetical protein